jgi:hypothetical protein
LQSWLQSHTILNGYAWPWHILSFKDRSPHFPLVQDRFKAWITAVSKKLQDAQGWRSARLLETSDGGSQQLHACFNGDLVAIVNDVRQLRSLGFAIPKNIENEVKVGFNNVNMPKLHHSGQLSTHWISEAIAHCEIERQVHKAIS